MTSPPVFWYADAGRCEVGDTVALTGGEQRHALVVRRLRSGARLDLCDGYGVRLQCRLAAAGECRVESVVVEPAASPRVVVVQALATGGRDEAAAAAMTEVGVDEIVPWEAARSTARWRGEKSLSRWQTTVREAAKQARRAWFPVVPHAASTGEVCDRLRAAVRGVVLHQSAGESILDLVVPDSGDVVVVVGPEGGLTDEELTAFTGAGGEALRLGPTVLRSGTAGVVAASVLLSRTTRWR